MSMGTGSPRLLSRRDSDFAGVGVGPRHLSSLVRPLGCVLVCVLPCVDHDSRGIVTALEEGAQCLPYQG